MESRKRKIILSVTAVIVIAGIIWAAVFAATYYPRVDKDTKTYIAAVNANRYVYKNTYTEAMPQTIAHDVIYNFFFGDYDHGGKTPKLLFIGYDGTQAVMPPIHWNNEFGAVKEVATQGGIYYTAAGGQKTGGQNSSTAPGWAAIFTGVWGTENGVTGNADVLREKTRSILYQLGEEGYKSSFSVSWTAHITLTYKKEVASAAKNNYPIAYHANGYDEETVATMLSHIEAGDDAIFGIFEYVDHMGHSTGFSKDNRDYIDAYMDAEESASLLIDAVKARPTYGQEDWLIIITTDHGGYGTSHGGITLTERLTFFALNKDLDALLFSYEPVEIKTRHTK